jgi:hypothetical protein
MWEKRRMNGRVGGKEREEEYGREGDGRREE